MKFFKRENVQPFFYKSIGTEVAFYNSKLTSRCDEKESNLDDRMIGCPSSCGVETEYLV
jgi:hypothetical protein